MVVGDRVIKEAGDGGAGGLGGAPRMWPVGSQQEPQCLAIAKHTCPPRDQATN